MTPWFCFAAERLQDGYEVEQKCVLRIRSSGLARVLRRHLRVTDAIQVASERVTRWRSEFAAVALRQ